MAWCRCSRAPSSGRRAASAASPRRSPRSTARRSAIPVEHRSRLVFSTLASAYNGLVANPLFTGVLGTELIKDPEAKARNLPANLIGGSIGYLIFFAAGQHRARELPAPRARRQPIQPIDVVLVVAVRAARAGAGAHRGRPVPGRRRRSSAGSRAARSSGRWSPASSSASSGSSRRSCCSRARPRSRRSSPTRRSYGAAVLLVMALVKLALLAVAFKSGFLGGPTFPAIFASVCVALAIGLLLPGRPRRRAHRRGHGRLPGGPVQGAVHGHPADRRDAPGRRRS